MALALQASALAHRLIMVGAGQDELPGAGHARAVRAERGKIRMTGQIPKYGAQFRHERMPYHPELASTRYVLKVNPSWHIRSDKTSHRWDVFHAGQLVSAYPFPAMRDAMAACSAAAAALDGTLRAVAPLTRRQLAAVRDALPACYGCGATDGLAWTGETSAICESCRAAELFES